MQRPILVVGSDGVIGSVLMTYLRRQGHTVVGTTRRRGELSRGSLFLDLALPASFELVKCQSYQATFICSAITSLQACEAEPEKTRRVNVEGTISLIELLSSISRKIIFLSTNLVYDGSRPFVSQESPVCPTTEYGKQKSIVESFLLNEVSEATVIRFGKVLEPHHPLFGDWLARLLVNQEIRPFSDKLIAPIALDTAVNILAWLSKDGLSGLFQVTASTEITYAEAAFTLAKLAHCDPSLVKPICSSDYPFPPRLHTSLQTSELITNNYGKLLPSAAIEYVWSSIMLDDGYVLEPGEM